MQVIFWATLIVLIFYGIEVIFKMVGCGARVFMRDRWNWFDLVVLGCSILTMEDQGGTVLIARFGKNVRFLRNIKAGKRLRMSTPLSHQSTTPPSQPTISSPHQSATLRVSSGCCVFARVGAL